MAEKKAWDGHQGVPLDTQNGYTIIDCETCEFIHAVPLPTQDELDEYYRRKCYTSLKLDYFARQKRDEQWWQFTFEKRLKLIERHQKTESRKIIDLGAGPGFFIRHASQLGWDGVGIEPSPHACEFSVALGNKMINQFFSPHLVDELEKFDVAYSHGVIEHIRDPYTFLASTREILKERGLFFISAANDYNPLQKAVIHSEEQDKWWVTPPDHLNYFTIDSMANALEKSGFEIVVRTAGFPMELFLLFGNQYVGDEKVGRECHLMRCRFEQALAAYDADELSRIYTSLANLGIGRQLEILARKK